MPAGFAVPEDHTLGIASILSCWLGNGSGRPVRRTTTMGFACFFKAMSRSFWACGMSKKRTAKPLRSSLQILPTRQRWHRLCGPGPKASSIMWAGAIVCWYFSQRWLLLIKGWIVVYVGTLACKILRFIASHCLHSFEQRWTDRVLLPPLRMPGMLTLLLANRTDKRNGSLFWGKDVVFNSTKVSAASFSGFCSLFFGEYIFVGSARVTVAVRIVKEAQLVFDFQDATTRIVDLFFHLAFF